MRKFTFRVDFSKDGKARFVSHRELMSIIERALRRADIPVALSEGFNPRPRISFPTALSIGISSTAEIVYIHLAEWLAPAEVHRRLNQQLAEIFKNESAHDGRQCLQINDVKPIYLSDIPHTFIVEYQIDLNNAAADKLDYTAQIKELLSQKEAVISRQGPDGSKEVDIRPYIRDIKGNGPKQIALTVNITNQGTVRPEEVTKALGITGSIMDMSFSIRKTKTTI
jgi:radical SAM-linked protein